MHRPFVLLGVFTALIAMVVFGGCKEAYVAPAPNPAFAADDSAQTFEDTPISVRVLDNIVNPREVATRVVAVTQPPNGTVTILGDGTIRFTPNAGFVHSDGNFDEFTYTVRDALGFRDTATVTVTVNPIPVIDVPEEDPTVPTSVEPTFLTSGENPVQVNVAANAIEPSTVAVIRGLVTDTLDAPLVGVTVSIVGQPQYGITITRANSAAQPNDAGRFDISVNGGGVLTLRFEKEGHLTLTRDVDVPAQDVVELPEAVRMTVLSTVVTQVASSSTTSQTIAAPEIVDDAGTRQPNVVIPQNTSASIQLPDGSTQPLSAMSVQVTEFTVGTNIEQQLPTPLPQGAGVAYGVNFAVQQASSAGAQSVTFSQPLMQYVENFLNVPSGSALPISSLSPSNGQWQAEPDGQVVEVVGVVNGIAQIDVTGDGVADSDAVLLAMNPPITLAERESLGTLYLGRTPISIWRVPVHHFSNFVIAFPRRPVVGGDPPTPAAVATAGNLLSSLDDPQIFDNDVVMEVRAVQQALRLVGTPFELVYRSERINAATKTLIVPIFGASLPPTEPTSVRVTAVIAGKSFEQTVQPPFSANQTVTLTWDGTSAYGQANGIQDAVVTVTHRFPAEYIVPPASSILKSQYGGLALSQLNLASAVSAGTRVTYDFRQVHRIPIGTFSIVGQRLGGFAISAHHAYDRSRGLLYTGDGRIRRGVTGRSTLDVTARRTIQTVAGGFGSFSSPGGAIVSYPTGVAVRALGGGGEEVYWVDNITSTVRMYTTGTGTAEDGKIHIVAGIPGQTGFTGDGGDPKAARLFCPLGIAVAADGTVYIADTVNNRIRQIIPGAAPITATVAARLIVGTQFAIDVSVAEGANFNIGDAVRLRVADAILDEALAKAASITIADKQLVGSQTRLVTSIAATQLAGAVVGTGGTLTKLGSGTTRIESLPLVGLKSPAALALANNDTVLFIADTGNHFIRRVDNVKTAPTMSTIAGNGTSRGFDGDGAALSKKLNAPGGIAATPDGATVFITDTYNHRIRRIAGGQITTIAGGQVGLQNGTGSAAQFAFPVGLGYHAAQNALYVADTDNNRVRLLTGSVATASASNITVSTAAGSGQRAVTSTSSTVAASAVQWYPVSVAIGANNALYVADYENNFIRRISPSGTLVNSTSDSVTRVAGTGGTVTSPVSIRLNPQGNVLFVDASDNRLREFNPVTNALRILAGSGIATDFQPTTPANPHPAALTQAPLRRPMGLAVDPATGDVYLVEHDRHQIRRFNAQTQQLEATPFAGTGEAGFSGDFGRADQSQLDSPTAIRIWNGGLVIADAGNARLRFVNFAPTAADRFIVTIVGTGATNFNGDSNIGTSTNIHTPRDMAVDSNDNLLFADSGHHRIRQLSPFGIVTTVAGSGSIGYDGITAEFNGLLATAARLNGPRSVAVAADGTIFIADTNNHRIRIVDRRTGHIRTLAGTGVGGFNGDHISPTQAQLRSPNAVALAENDTVIYIGDTGNNRLRRVQIAQIRSGLANEEIAVPNDDGTQIFVFTQNGRHLRTLDGLTGQLRYTFNYNANNLLTSITNAEGQNVLTINRAGDGAPQSITTPRGTTTLGLDGTARLTSVQNPALQTWSFTYHGSTFRMTSRTNPANQTDTYAYDADGLLQQVTRHEGEIIALSSQTSTHARFGRIVETTATLTPTAGSATTFTAMAGRSGFRRVGASSLLRRWIHYAVPPFVSVATEGTTELTLTNALTHRLHADPRWAGAAMFTSIEQTGVVTPRSRTAGPSSAALQTDPFAVTQLTETAALSASSRAEQTVFDVGSPNNTSRQSSPEGTVTFTYDSLNRIISEQVSPPAGASGGATISTTWDTNGYPQQVATPGGTMSVNVNHATRTITMTLGVVEETIVFDAADRWQTHTVRRTSDSAILLSENYTYTATGRVQSIQRTFHADVVGGGLSFTTTYTYDATGRLESYANSGGLTDSQDYAPDGNGRLAVTDDGSAIVYASSTARPTSVGGSALTYADTTRVSAFGGTSFTFDAKGNLTAIGGTTMSYDTRDRVVQRGSEFKLLWRDQIRPAALLDAGTSNVTTQFVYVLGRHVPEIALVGANARRIITDHRGSPLLVLTAADGASVRAVAQYRPFGSADVVTAGSSAESFFGWSGGVTLASDVLQFGDRTYHAQAAHWFEPSKELFNHAERLVMAYGDNDPINRLAVRGAQYRSAGTFPAPPAFAADPAFWRPRPLSAR